MRLIFESDDMLRFENLFHLRAAYMVPGAMQEGREHAEAYAQAGGRHAHRVGRYQARRGARRRLRHATGAQVAWMQEKVFYRRFIDFFGDWT